MMKHTVPAVVLAAAAALFAAFTVLWFPSITGEVLTGAGLAFWLAVQLGHHKHVKRGAEAGLLGALGATLLIVFVPAAVPAVVAAAMLGPTAAYHLNPRRVRPVRTTRGVRTTAGKAAGGRAGRPGEKAHRSRPPRSPSSTPVQKRPGHAASSSPSTSPPPSWPPAPGGPPAASWPHASGDVSPSTFLPWAGESEQAWPEFGDLLPKRLRRDEHRPGATARSLCGDCLTGDCQRCKDRGCECPRSGHPLRDPRPAPVLSWPGQDDDEIPF